MNARFIDKIRSHPDSSFQRGATERQIASAQKRLGVTFPPSYRKFLCHFNGGEFRFARMYRITQTGAGFFDLAEQMAVASQFFGPFRDRSILLFGDDYSGNYYCFELAKANRKGECPVVLVDRLLREDWNPKHQASCLNDFIARGLQDA
jgi:hypothetical protein